MDIDKFVAWTKEYFISPPKMSTPEEYNIALAGYLFGRYERNKYQREWRNKNKEKCEKYYNYKSFTEEKKDKLREYQRKYYQKRKLKNISI